MPKILAAIGRFSARHRILVVMSWLLVLAGLVTVLVTAPATDDASAEPSIPDTPAAQALEIVNEEFPSLAADDSAGDTLQLVFQAGEGALATDPAVATEISGVLSDADGIAHVTSVSNPFDPARPFVSADQTTAVATVTFESMTDAQIEETYDEILALAADAPGDLLVEVGGSLTDTQVPEFNPGESVGILIAFVVLFLTFGSLLAAGANMLVALVGVAIGAIGVLAYGALNPIQPSTLTLGTMLGLAVGIDYSLFILTRFRAELRAGRSVEDAVARSVGTAGTAVVFAGLTVIIALAGLSVVGISFVTEMGIAGAFGVLIAVLVALTLLPVLMRTLGLRALPARERRSIRMSPIETPTQPARKTLFERWAAFLVKRPVVSILGGVLLLAVVAIPMLGMKTAQTVPGGLDPASTERRAYDLVVEEFGGIQSPLVILLRGDDVESHIAAVEDEIDGLDGVQMVIPGAVNASGDAALLTVIPTEGPIDESTKSLVTEIREHAEDTDGVRLDVTGETAIGIDMDEALQAALIKYLIVIVALSFVLLTILFRSLLVPLIATLGFLLSVGASFGASVAVFQWGWLDPLIAAPQGDPMIGILPILLVGVLFGLAMDYQVFLVSRIQEMHGRGLSPKKAIVAGMKTSGPVLVAAAAIMAFVFAGFATSPMSVAASIAFGLVVGVIADAFIVRMVLMPALLSLLGKAAWWLPGWLDRMLPNLDVEGHTLDERPAQKPVAAQEPQLVS